jgi:hypothetical protein
VRKVGRWRQAPQLSKSGPGSKKGDSVFRAKGDSAKFPAAVVIGGDLNKDRNGSTNNVSLSNAKVVNLTAK